jgi:uncharacterized membrane protein
VNNDENKNSSLDSSDSERPTTEIALPSDGADEDIGQLLEGIPLEKRARIIEIVTSNITESKSHSGWLPTPEDLKAYNDVLPGLAERIVAMPEREQTHRHLVIETMVKDDRDLKSRGQRLAMVSLILLLSVSVLLIALGQYDWGARIAIFGIVGVVGIFVTGKWVDSKFAKNKHDLLEDED